MNPSPSQNDINLKHHKFYRRLFNWKMWKGEAERETECEEEQLESLKFNADINKLF